MQLISTDVAAGCGVVNVERRPAPDKAPINLLTSSEFWACVLVGFLSRSIRALFSTVVLIHVKMRRFPPQRRLRWHLHLSLTYRKAAHHRGCG